jgi:hypothetical protein
MIPLSGRSNLTGQYLYCKLNKTKQKKKTVEENRKKSSKGREKKPKKKIANMKEKGKGKEPVYDRKKEKNSHCIL